ncbi:MAG TPA: RnfH family protein [Burkholderiales bacterium]|nr:RnfH family protein [Burkholderiales bacterium]
MSSIRVEVVYARGKEAVVVPVRLPAGSRVQDALAASGIAGIDLAAVGVFGRRVQPDAHLADGDRVEVYRPLLLDPKEQRRRRARRK